MWKLSGLFIYLLSTEIVSSLWCYETPEESPYEAPVMPVIPKLKDCYLQRDPVCYTMINYTIHDGKSLVVVKNCRERGDCAKKMRSHEMKKQLFSNSQKKQNTAIDCIECYTDECNVNDTVDPSRISSSSNISKHILLNLCEVVIAFFIFFFVKW